MPGVPAGVVSAVGRGRWWDTAAKAPYLWKADEGRVVTYDDPDALQRFAREARTVAEPATMPSAFFWFGQMMNQTLKAITSASHMPSASLKIVAQNVIDQSTGEVVAKANDKPCGLAVDATYRSSVLDPAAP
mgnify:CR=1 FL=1